MPRVLIFHPALAPYRIDLFNALALRCSLRVVFLSDGLLSQELDQAALRARLSVDHGFLKRGVTIFNRHFRLGVSDTIGAFCPDIVVTHEFSPLTIQVVATKRILRRNYRHVVWSADNPMMTNNDSLPRKIIRQQLLPAIDGLVLYTNDVAAVYKERMKYQGPIAIVPNIADEQRFEHWLYGTTDTAADLINKYSLSGKRVILYVGRLSHEKRVDILIKAFAGLCRDMPDCMLAVVGDGKERQFLERTAEKCGVADKVLFTGRQEGVVLAAWYRIGGVLVLASEFEPFGAVVNEALLAGMPVVCSSMVGAKSLIQDGENGSVVSYGNTTKLGDALRMWSERTKPVSLAKVYEPRRSLMPIRFSDVVKTYVSLLAGLASEGS